MQTLLASPYRIKQKRRRRRKIVSVRQHYNYFRDYSPGDGRYVQSDPIGLDGGLATYGYAYQNPMRYVDPDGLDPFGGAFRGAYQYGRIEQGQRIARASELRNREYSVGIGGTAFGGSIGGSHFYGLAISRDGVSVVLQGCGGGGAGVYLGGGIQGGYGEKPDCENQTGLQPSLQWGAAGGSGPSLEISGPLRGDGLSGSGSYTKPRVGAGAGWYGAVFGCLTYRHKVF
jgi:RHS repeat-associated protein